MRPRRCRVQAPSDDKIRALFESGTYDFVPHDNMRKIIARRLVEAKQTIPHFYLTMNCTIDKLLAAREDINTVARKDQDGKPAWKISVNDFVIKAMALALMRVPDANVTWTEGGMLKHKRADVGVAVAIPGGLMTPVIRHAETKTLIEISSEMKDLAARARNRRLKPEEYQGGSTAISNLGMYGVHEFRRRHQPAACDDIGGWGWRAASDRSKWQDRDCDPDDCDAVDRSSRCGRRARRRALGRVSHLH